MLGRRGAALVYAAAALLAPASIVAAMVVGAFPKHALVAVLPALVLQKPLAWALGTPDEEVPLPAMGANVVWNLATNTALALALAVATIMR
jgi:1,4-dihydroxy-2-naphthoate octaprenyltransferase